jgi:uncharacterized caspase-like protein
MHRIIKISFPVLAVLACVYGAVAEPSEKRMALVIGNASYQAKSLATPINDAALIAQTLQAAGFDVMGARDLDEGSLRSAFREFVDGLSRAGPDTVAVVYFSGYALQLEGENYLLPVDANITHDSDVPPRTVRLSDFTRPMAALQLKAAFVILDAARASPFALSGSPLAGGLAWVEPEPNMLVAFNATPGTAAPNERDGYGQYARALAEMIREGGLTSKQLFDRVRLRVNDLSKGAQVPWDASKIEAKFVFFERGSAAPAQADAPERTAWMRTQPMRSLGASDAYITALLRDTFDGYGDFLADYGGDPMAKRIRAILAARREAITWRRTYQDGSPEAYWTYLKRYPRGPHIADAHRLLVRLGAAIEPPPNFKMLVYDVPVPAPDELEYIERPVLVFDDPEFEFAPPKPPSRQFLERPPPEFRELAPPSVSHGVHGLPVPVFTPLPTDVNVPANVVAPPNPFIFDNIHDAAVVDGTSTTSSVTATTKSDSQVALSLQASPMDGGASNDASGLPTLIAPDAALLNLHKPPPPATNPRTGDKIETPLNQPSTAPSPSDVSAIPPIAPLEPRATDDQMPPIDDQRPATTAMVAPPAADDYRPPLRGTLSSQIISNIPLPSPRPTAIGRRATNIAPANPLAAMVLPLAAGNTPLPAARPLVSPSSNVPLPIPRVPIAPATGNPLRSSAIAMPRSGQPPVSAVNQPSSPPTASAPAGSRVANHLPLNPQAKTCPLVNGRRICN